MDSENAQHSGEAQGRTVIGSCPKGEQAQVLTLPAQVAVLDNTVVRPQPRPDGTLSMTVFDQETQPVRAGSRAGRVLSNLAKR